MHLRVGDGTQDSQSRLGFLGGAENKAPECRALTLPVICLPG